MKDIYRIGKNPYIGRKVWVRWKRAWGRKEPGFEAEGVLLRTFCVNHGRTLIGEIRVENGKKLACPWSRNFLEVRVIE